MTDTHPEKRARIRVALWAYAYEAENDPLVSDERYDAVARSIDPTRSTDNPVLDAFFRSEFSPYTGAWVWKHPELHRVRAAYNRMRRGLWEIDTLKVRGA